MEMQSSVVLVMCMHSLTATYCSWRSMVSQGKRSNILYTEHMQKGA
jgi:hypothetical protein